jgi:uncharacterized protein (UPF0276 family)
MDIFISWVEGMGNDSKALNTIKGSNFINGIESGMNDGEAKKIRDFGIEVSLHNPIRGVTFSLENPGIKEILKERQEEILDFKTIPFPFIGFHVGYLVILYDMKLPENPIKQIEANVGLLKKLLNKEIAFETAPLEKEMLAFGNIKAKKYLVSPKFIKDVIARTNMGYIFDISHVFVSAATLAHMSNLTLNEILSDVIEASAGNVLELHLNLPKEDLGVGFKDAHLPFDFNSGLTRRLLEVVKRVIEENQGLHLINLEMETYRPPFYHVKILEKQAEFLRSELDLK